MITGISQVAEALISIKRLQKFMMSEEVETAKIDGSEKSLTDDSTENSNNFEENRYSVSLVNASAKWLAFEKEDTLENININVKPGELIAIVGQVGSGKTSVLNVILNELPVHTGTLKVNFPFFFFK